MYRKFALFAASLSLFSLALTGCQKEAEPAATAAPAAPAAPAEPAKPEAPAAPVAVTDPAKLVEALKPEAGLAGVTIKANDKGELVMTGKVADQTLKAKADELIKAAGGTVKNAIIVGK